MFCSDLSGLLHEISKERCIPLESADLRFGIDGGQGWLKLGLLVTDRSEVIVEGRSTYAEVKII